MLAALQIQLEPAAVALPKPKRRRAGGFMGMGGGGGGNWIPCAPVPPPLDPHDPDPPRRRLEVPDEPTEPVSTADAIASLLGLGHSVFAGSKRVTAVLEQHFGKHAAAASALGTIAAVTVATGKIKHPFARKVEGPMILGSLVAAVDDLVDIYVNERGAGMVVVLHTPLEILQKAKDAPGGLVVTSFLGVRKSTGQRSMLLRYQCESGTPTKTYRYHEFVGRSATGAYPLTGTLLAILRK